MSDQENANFLVPTVLFGWPIILLLLYMVLPSRRATAIAFIFAWLFLPVAQYKITGLPDWNKMTATCIGIFMATVLFDVNRFLEFRPRWLDIPVVILCVCPLASSLANGLGLYDGLSESFRLMVRWGLPYFLGRVYFSDREGMRELAVAVFIGGLVYLPLCLYELRMSPQLHNIVYGYHQSSFEQSIRYGGYRPVVFMEHGLMVGMWMASATLCGLALWRSGTVRTFFGISTLPFVAALFVMTLLCKSTGAIIVMLLGVAALASFDLFGITLAVPALAAVSVVYIVLRASGLWDGQSLVDVSSNLFEADRVSSLATRINNEDALSARARMEPVFGWGGWGRSRIYDAQGKDISITDSQWIITFGSNGAVGLLALLTSILLPAVLLRRKVPPGLWTNAACAAPVVFAVLVTLWMMDNCVNAMFNPVYVLMVGGLAGLGRLVIVPRAFLRRTQPDEGPIPVPFAPERPATIRARRRTQSNSLP